jgi:hypothetical protein
VLLFAPAADPSRHRGTVLVLASTRFAPSPRPLADYASGASDDLAFARRYTWELRQLWHDDGAGTAPDSVLAGRERPRCGASASEDRSLFLDVVAQAETTDVTITHDASQAEQHACRVLAAADAPGPHQTR